MKRSNYSEETLREAVDDYINGATSSEVTKKFGIPASTIRNHKSNPTLKVGGGRPGLLSKEQDTYLMELLKNIENAGLPLTKPTLLMLSSEYVQLVTGKVLNKTAQSHRFLFYDSQEKMLKLVENG